MAINKNWCNNFEARGIDIAEIIFNEYSNASEIPEFNSLYGSFVIKYQPLEIELNDLNLNFNCQN